VSVTVLTDKFGPVMEITCSKCNKPVMRLQMIDSTVNFTCTCHHCGTEMEGENFTNKGIVEDDNFRKWQASKR
jgi:hypothetical protein